MVALVFCCLGLALLPLEICEYQRLHNAAVRARDMIVVLIGFQKFPFDCRKSLDGGRTQHENFMVWKGSSTGDRQVDRRSLAVQVLRVSVHLVQNQIPDRDRP